MNGGADLGQNRKILKSDRKSAQHNEVTISCEGIQNSGVGCVNVWLPGVVFVSMASCCNLCSYLRCVILSIFVTAACAQELLQKHNTSPRQQ